jgi:hypothetical protein
MVEIWEGAVIDMPLISSASLKFFCCTSHCKPLGLGALSARAIFLSTLSCKASRLNQTSLVEAVGAFKYSIGILNCGGWGMETSVAEGIDPSFCDLGTQPTELRATVQKQISEVVVLNAVSLSAIGASLRVESE